MIQLTNQIIAVEVPNDATIKELTVTENNRKQIMDACTEKGKGTKVLVGDISLIGVTPLSEDEWKEVVKNHVFDNYFDYVNPNSGDYARGYMCGTATESGLSLLKSKGLDINKKYAIIKIEK